MAKTVIFSACLILSVILSAFASSYTTPVFFWSNTNYFLGQNEQIVDVTSLQSLKSALTEVQSKEAHLLKVNRNVAKPELIVIFVEPELKTSQMSVLANAYGVQPNGGVFAHLKRNVESARSSIVVPYASSESAIGSSLSSSIASSLSKDAIVTVASSAGDKAINKNSNKITLRQLLEIATPSWTVLSNGVTDLLVVYLEESFESDDSLLNNVCNSLKDSSYVAVYTADSPAPSVQKRFPVSHESLSTFEQMQDQSLYQASLLSSSSDYWTDDIITAVIIMVPFIFILFVGLCCTFRVQVPLKMDAEKPKKN